MRVGHSGKNLLRPYIIINLITIWSFLLTTILIQACPNYFPKAIGPPSRASPIVSVVCTDQGPVVLEDRKKTQDEHRREFSFAYINFCIGKALRNNSSIAELRDRLSSYKAWHLHVEKIPKWSGFYLTWQRGPRDPPRILHYFLNEKKSHTGKYVILNHDINTPLLIESLDETTYQGIKNTIKVLFSPEDGCEEELISAIDSAEKTIDAAVYSFTSRNIFNALKKARQRGVPIRLFLNGRRDLNKLGKESEACGIKVKYYSKRGSLMHNKFMLVDEEKVFSGSYNWTDQAEKENRENLIILPYMAGFKSEFNCLWDNRTRPPPRARSPPSSIQALFSPKGGCEDEIKRLIRSTSIQKQAQPEIPRSIKIALYFFTNKDIAKELFYAKENGIDIEIVLDKSQRRPSYAAEKYLRDLQKKAVSAPAEKGRLVLRYYRIDSGMMHNKFAVIGNVTVTGSYNWTRQAEDKNKENLIILPSAVKDYLEEFKRLWAGVADETVIDEGHKDLSKYSGLDPPATQAYQYSHQGPGPLSSDEIVAKSIAILEKSKGRPATDSEKLEKLKECPAASFYGGKYNRIVTDEDIIVYRAGAGDRPKGHWFTRLPPLSEIQVRIDSAIRREWINAAGEITGVSLVEAVCKYKIPKGSVIYEGPTSYQGAIYLGGYDKMQIYVDDETLSNMISLGE